MDTEMKKNDSTTETDTSHNQCGYLFWRPAWLQRFNNPKFLLACVCCSAFVQGFVVNGLTPTNVSSIERRYNLRSGLVAYISSAYDISAGIFAIIFGYLAMFLHIGRMLGICTLVMGIGSLTMFLPHAFSGTYELGPRPSEMCDLSDNATSFCDTYTEGESSSYLWLFLLGQICHGVGGAAIYTVAIPYMDENIRNKDSALYIGIMMAFSALGPAIGFIGGGALLSIYVDTGKIDDEDISITPDDPRWVGAWWIGYLLSFILCLFASFFYFGFPKQLPSAEKYAPERVSQAYKGSGEERMRDDDFGKSFSDILYSLKVIFTNPAWVLLTISGIVESSGVVGFTAFLPKILQFQYSQSMVMAAVWAGVVVIPGAAGGELLGGLVPKWLNLKVRGLLIQSIICTAIAVALVFQFLLRCDMPTIAGISVSYFNRSLDLDAGDQDVFHPCNEACNCSLASYDPICGQDGVEYFTPCHGGCQETFEYSGDDVYSNCSCISDPEPGWELPGGQQAGAGICGGTCSIFPLFLILFFFVNIVTFMTSVAGQAATIRCVPDKQKAFAYGVQAFLTRFLGNAPGPLILGAIFDESCWLWQDTCGREGSCWIYSPDDLALRLTLFALVIKVLSLVSMCLALFLYKPPPLQVVDMQEVNADVTDFQVTPQENGHQTLHKMTIDNDIKNIDCTYNNAGYCKDSIDIRL